MSAPWREAFARAAGRATGPLGLAAAPTFALMALLTAVLGGGRSEMLCGTGHESALTGMVAMYVLMGCFHAAPWLRLIAGRSRAGDRIGA